MATASLNIRLSYNQILELARQLSDEDKLQFNRELSAEVRKIEMQRLLQVFKNDEISLEEISSEVELVDKQGMKQENDIRIIIDTNL